MHPVMFAAFDRLCRQRAVGGRVLEIGALPGPDSLLNLPALAGATAKIGLSLDGPHRTADFEILQGNANAMERFADASFDAVLCNSVLEHDPRFWLTLAEIRRVARPGALIAIGVPGYGAGRLPLFGAALGVLRGVPVIGPALHRRYEWLSAAVPTLGPHDFPGDYYRFSAPAMAEILLAGLRDVEVTELMQPPRILGSGLKP